MISLSAFSIEDLREMLQREKSALEKLNKYIIENEFSKDIFNLLQTKKKNIQVLESLIKDRQSRNLN